MTEKSRKSKSAKNRGKNKGTAGGPTVAVAQVLEMFWRLPCVDSREILEARRKIADGTMVTDEKLGIAIDRMLDDLLVT